MKVVFTQTACLSAVFTVFMNVTTIRQTHAQAYVNEGVYGASSITIVPNGLRSTKSNGRLGGVALGSSALRDNLGGNFNVAIGEEALMTTTMGGGNTALGSYTLRSNLTGASSTAVGFGALNKSTANNNTAVGANVLRNMTTGTLNTAIGNNAGFTNDTGDQNVFLGAYADASLPALTNAIAVGYQASVNASNKAVIGNASVTTIGGYGAWTNYSDRRLKENITYSKQLGLSFINQLKTASYNYRDDINKRHRDGLIAQDVQNVLKNMGISFSALVEDNDKDKTLNLSYAEFVLPLINAVQELSKRIEYLENKAGMSKVKSADNQVKE